MAAAGERRQGQGRSRWVAPGHGDTRGAAQCLTAELGKPVGQFAQQLRHWMGCAVPLRVQLWVGQPEVRTQVDHAADALVQVGNDRRAGHVRQAQEHHVEPDEDLGVVCAVAKIAVVGRQAGIQVADRRTRLRVAGDGDHIK